MSAVFIGVQCFQAYMLYVIVTNRRSVIPKYTLRLPRIPCPIKTRLKNLQYSYFRKCGEYNYMILPAGSACLFLHDNNFPLTLRCLCLSSSLTHIPRHAPAVRVLLPQNAYEPHDIDTLLGDNNYASRSYHFVWQCSLQRNSPQSQRIKAEIPAIWLCSVTT